jgi:hypothetical protein
MIPVVIVANEWPARMTAEILDAVAVQHPSAVADFRCTATQDLPLTPR